MKSKLKIVLFIILIFLTLTSLLVYFLIPTVVIDLNGNREIVIEVGEEYKELGVNAYAKNLLQKKTITTTTKSNVDTTKLGNYKVDYEAVYNDKTYTKTRNVIVKDTSKPTIEVKGDIKVCKSNNQIQLDVTAHDNYDGDISNKVTYKIENDKIYLNVSDSSNNITEISSPIKYIDNEKPKITLQGSQTINLYVGETYTEYGATATDSCDGNLSKKITINGNVDINKVGEYEITYTVLDSQKNETKIVRKVIVKEHEIPTGDKILYLTFDDGPGQYTERLLEILASTNVKATFFVTNQFPKYQDLIRKEYEAGHTIGIHTYSHKWSVYDSVDSYLNDFNMMEQIVYEKTGVHPKIFRFPGGSSNTVSKKHCKGIMTELSNLMTNKGYIYYDWSFDSGDTSKNKNSTQDIINTVKSYINKPGKYIVLMHDLKKNTVEAIPTIIAYAKEHGYEFRALSEDVQPIHFKIAN